MTTTNDLAREFNEWTPDRKDVEIARLRFQLARIANAPVPESNEIAMTLKRWAMPDDDISKGDADPTDGMMGAGVGIFLRSVTDIAGHCGDLAELTEALHDGADPIVRDIYLAMCDALESEGL